MASSRAVKRRIVTALSNLPADLQEAVQNHYPTGYTDAMMRIDKPNGDFFYAVPFSTDEAEYLVKITVKIDDKGHEEDDKGYYDDEIKGDENIDDHLDDEEDEM